MKALLNILGISICVMVVSCQRADIEDTFPGGNGSADATLTNIQATIFNLNCAIPSCHTGGSPPQGMNLSEGQAFSNIVGVPSMEVPDLQRINPGNPDLSYLYLKILGDDAIIGSRMPFGRDPLSTEQIDLVRQWIEAGALDN